MPHAEEVRDAKYVTLPELKVTPTSLHLAATFVDPKGCYFLRSFPFFCFIYFWEGGGVLVIP
jgi:hypothetical protein